MAQVHNRVNAGVMDGICYGGMMEESAQDKEWHYTTVENLQKILEGDEFRLNNQERGVKGRIKDFHMSLSRIRSCDEGYGLYMSRIASPLVRIELDGRAINNIRGVDIRPYDYWYNAEGSKPARQLGGQRAEAEDSLTVDCEYIPDVHDLISRIDILLTPFYTYRQSVSARRFFFWADYGCGAEWKDKFHFYCDKNLFNRQASGKGEMTLSQVTDPDYLDYVLNDIGMSRTQWSFVGNSFNDEVLYFEESTGNGHDTYKINLSSISLYHVNKVHKNERRFLSYLKKEGYDGFISNDWTVLGLINSESLLSTGVIEPMKNASRETLDESTDCVKFDGHYYDCYFSNAIAFMSLIRKDGSKGPVFIAPPGNLHGNLKAYLVSSHKVTPDEYGKPSELKVDDRRTGRFWFGHGCNIISFYSYSDNPKQIYDNCIEALLAIQKETDADFNIGEVMVDLWTKNIKNPIIMPVRWFNNGMAEMFLPITEKCEPYESFDGTFRYRLSTSKGNFTADWKGDDIEQEQEHVSLNESKDMDRKTDYDKYIKSLIDFMREQHLNIDPLPKIELNPEEQDGIFVKTGYYSPDEKKVVVFTDQRHPKDVLRTVAHEFIHHMQNLQNPDKDWGTGGDLEADGKLRSIEGEAFLLGNIIFREWTEKMKKTKELNESINIKKALMDLKNRRDPDDIEDWNRLDEIVAEIVEPDDVDLSSFSIKKHLNPKFWDDGHLDTRIRLKLLDIADDFFDSLDVDWVEPEDIIITGSIANYNWNKKYSDIDLHILIDYEDVDERVDFVREYFTLKKNEWNEKHKNLRIFGFPVEVYVQDSKEPHASTGVYSVDRDEWITEPDRDEIRSGKVDKKHVREMVSTYMNKIDCLIDIYHKHKDDEYEMRKVSEDAAEMMDEIRKMRKDDLAKYGREMCDGNIIFKALRRSDYIGKLLKLRDLAYDKMNSI